MKICYVDMNEDDCVEHYHPSPKRYGGGRVIASAMLSRYADFHIYGNPLCFEGVEQITQCHGLSLSSRQAIKRGEPLKNFIPDADSYELFFHHFSDVYLNLDGCASDKQTVWPVGWRETLHPKHKYALYFDIKNQEPYITSCPKIFNITIGPKFPDFKEYQKSDYIFQCSRHCNLYQSAELAQMCAHLGIKIVFAGPIDAGYPLLEFIDNKNTFYLGVIEQKEKEENYKRACFNTQCQSFDISVTLAGKEAASFGTPIIATRVGGWKDFIQEGVNGFFIDGTEKLSKIWQQRHQCKQLDCYSLAKEKFSEDKMVSMVTDSLTQIRNEI